MPPARSGGRGRDRREHPGAVIVALDSPGVREFLNRATMDGLIRTAAAGPGRILVVSTSPRFAPGWRVPGR